MVFGAAWSIFVAIAFIYWVTPGEKRSVVVFAVDVTWSRIKRKGNFDLESFEALRQRH